MPNVYRVNERKPKINALIYGEAGVGKTSLAATCLDHPDLSPALLINVEGGTLSIAGSNMDAVDVKTKKDIEEVFWALANRDDPEWNRYKTVIIDSGTELQTVTLEEIAVNAARKDRQRDPDEIYLTDYGRNTAALRRLFRWFRDLPVNVVMTALSKEVYPPGTSSDQRRVIEPTQVYPLFTEKLGHSVAGYFDFVWYMYLRNGERYLLTQRNPRFFAKTRGVYFAAALGPTVRIRDLDAQPEENGEVPGHTLATLYQVLLDVETAKGERK